MKTINTTNVEDMSFMFAESKINEVDFSSVDVKSLNNISHMFESCDNLNSIDLSPFNMNTNTKNVKDMSYMFLSCSSLDKIIFGNFDSSSVQNMKGLFQNCVRLTSLEIPSFKTSNVKDMSYTFG